MAIQWEDGDQCPVCNHGDTGEPVTMLPCAHKIHEPCLVELREAMQCSMDDLKCPVCKKTGNDIVELERQLLRPDRSSPSVVDLSPDRQLLPPDDSTDDELAGLPHSIFDDAYFAALEGEGECVESESDFEPDPVERMDVDEFLAPAEVPSPPSPPAEVPLHVEAKASPPSPPSPPPPPKFNPVMAAFRLSVARSSDSLAQPDTPLGVVDAAHIGEGAVAAALETLVDDNQSQNDAQDDQPLTSLVAPKLPAAVPKAGRPKSGRAQAAPKSGAANGAAPKSGAAKAGAAPKSGAAKAVPKSGAATAAVPKSRRPKSGAAKAAPKAGAAAAPKPLAAPPAQAAVPKQAEHLPKSLAVPLAEAAVPKPLAVPLAEAAVPKQAERLDNAIVPADHFVTKAILDRRPQAPPGFARMAIPVPKQQGPDTEVLFCNWCNQPVSVSNVRVTSKSSSKYKCNKCQSTFVKMHNANGSWPTAAFNAIPNENQIEFYRLAAAESKTGEVKKIMDKCLEKYSRREFTWALGGTYLPLTAWTVKGFDAERIEKTSLPEDITWNDQCGWCYRVRLFSATTSGTEGQMMSQRLSATSGDMDAKRPRIEDAPAASSAFGETAEAFQQRRKQELQARKDADKAANQKKMVASQLLKKLSPSLEQLRQQCTLAKQKSLPCANAIAKVDEASAIQTELEKFTTGVGSESDPVMQKEVRV
jgi:hypothetical protein